MRTLKTEEVLLAKYIMLDEAICLHVFYKEYDFGKTISLF